MMMENIEEARHSTYSHYSQAQNEMKSLNVSIKDLELNLERASDGMKPRYEKVLKSKQSELANVSMTLDRHTKRLDYLNSPLGAEEFDTDTASIPKDFPYGNLSRKTLDDETKIKIIKDYGQKAYLSMPI